MSDEPPTVSSAQKRHVRDRPYDIHPSFLSYMRVLSLHRHQHKHTSVWRDYASIDAVLREREIIEGWRGRCLFVSVWGYHWSVAPHLL